MSDSKQTLYIDASALLSDKLSGVGHLTLNMIKGLLGDDDFTKKYTIKLIAPKRKVYLLSNWGLDNVNIVQVPLPARIWNILPRIRMIPPIDLFIGKGIYLYPNFRAWPLGVSRAITYVHDISFIIFPEFTETKNLKMLSGNIDRWISKSDIVITDSNASRQEIIDYYPDSASKLRVVYCGVNAEEFKENKPSVVNEVKAKYGLSQPYIMFLSSIEPRKNVERLLGSLDKLPSVYKKTYSLLLVGGMGWNNESIYRRIDVLKAAGWNIIIPKEYVSDDELPMLLNGASLLVHPALHEGFGIPPVEAMSSGTPVVVSDIPVMREVCGDAAIYADPYSEDDIAKKIQYVLENQKVGEKLVKLGHAQAEKYTWRNATNALIEEIESVSNGMKQ